MVELLYTRHSKISVIGSPFGSLEFMIRLHGNRRLLVQVVSHEWELCGEWSEMFVFEFSLYSRVLGTTLEVSWISQLFSYL